MISVAGKKSNLPIYWKNLSHKGASNLSQQKAVIPPLLKPSKKI